MNIKEEAAKLRKKIEKLNWQLTSGLALSQKQRDQQEDKIDELKKELKGVGKKLTEIKCTKMSVKLHLL